MKTTVDIQDNLLRRARKLAADEKTTVRALIEEGLRRVIEERRGAKAFRLRKASFKGKGLQPHLAGSSWDEIRNISYEGRGA
jgi:CRISPR/Cas system-associated protein Csm6